MRRSGRGRYGGIQATEISIARLLICDVLMNQDRLFQGRRIHCGVLRTRGWPTKPLVSISPQMPRLSQVQRQRFLYSNLQPVKMFAQSVYSVEFTALVCVTAAEPALPLYRQSLIPLKEAFHARHVDHVCSVQCQAVLMAKWEWQWPLDGATQQRSGTTSTIIAAGVCWEKYLSRTL